MSNVSYAIAKTPTPILNRPDFSSVFHSQGIVLDSLGLLKALEMIAFPNTIFQILYKHPNFPYIYEVKLESYAVAYPLYVDERFLKFCSKQPEVIKLEMPSADQILQHMQSLVGKPYVWGGNYNQGLEEIINWYPPATGKKLSFIEDFNWRMKGVDCSGMLYEATQGITPRNTSWLAEYGEGLHIVGLKNTEIAALLQPLDMIIWHGHVLFVLDQQHTIESRACRGCVFVTPLLERLEQIKTEEKKIPMNDSKHQQYKEKGFIIRRWY